MSCNAKVIPVGLFMLGILFFMGCTSAVQTVKRGAHRKTQKPMRIDEPTPAARIERIPLRRDSDCRWIDGYWERNARNWQWVKGRWVYPPESCYFAPPETSFEQEAVGLVLNYRPAVWYPERGNGACGPVKACTSSVE